MASTNQSTIFGLNFELLGNVWRSEIPPNSSKWHPQSTAQWFSVQTKMCGVAVLFGLIWQCTDEEIASWVSWKKNSAHSNIEGKIKLNIIKTMETSIFYIL